MIKFIVISFLLISSDIYSAEQSFKGLVDTRVVSVEYDTQSYLSGNYGKFNFDSDTPFTLAQLGLQYTMKWENNLSFHAVGNIYIDGRNNGIGLTEAFLSYRNLPNQNGWRIKSKIGVFYPKISFENIATAWSTPYTLTSSSLNNWVGEELRHSGFQLTLDKLGKFNKSQHNFSFDISLFQNNDTAGAMLSWHGWTLGNRQTLLNEKLVVQPFAARSTTLATQASYSDPFIELDNRWGTHLTTNWQYDNYLTISGGIYNNNADASIVKSGQYTWDTNFKHVGIKYNINQKIQLISQYMTGNTFMQSPYGDKVVENDFNSGFIMLRFQQNKHQYAIRVEEFEVKDFDSTVGDNNNEYGKGITLSYRYKLNKRSFIHSEFNWLNSSRPARWYLKQDVNLTEQQFQLAFRHYF
ncbi:hypothetical protein CJF42_01445 [Pseudoalteromonas sp. NBT06-2]|uniref:hypothetical protein n=1 Tax=Pseudoalteromonas sp. NBT06-2 TaxID=2025950 RepID=UPI000BA653A8|nr:hypothetical protein [Pseudoalteromonas sp. NBT06-2]PAJ76170.1 hypothetical protein CJF42_01445 [Pseudoalteromonas sp. NBT06-2]